MPLPQSLSRLIDHLPAKLRRSLDNLSALRSSVSDPRQIITLWRHRAQFRRVHRALFFQRWANGILLCHEVGLFEALARGAAGAEELARRCGLEPHAAEALLRILESERLVTRAGERFALSRFARLALTRAGEQTMSPFLDLMAAQAAAFAELPACVKSGATPAALDIFSPESRYPAFLAGVNAYLAVAGRDLLGRIELPEVKTFIVGSMGVSLSALVLERCPEARVTYGCLEHLVREIPALREQYGVPAERVDGMHAHGGDPLLDRWGDGDEAFDLVVLTKKMILQPSQRMGEKFARKAFQVLRPGGVAILWETLHTDDRPTPLPRAMEALLDLGASPGGLVHSERSMRALLLGGIGFASVDIVPCMGGQTTFVVARK